MIKLREDALAKMIMDEMRGSEEDAPNRLVGLVCSEYSESFDKQKKVLKDKSASQPMELLPTTMTPPALLTPEEVNKMIEERFAEIEKKRMGVPVFNSNVALPPFAKIQNTQLPPKFSFPHIIVYDGSANQIAMHGDLILVHVRSTCPNRRTVLRDRFWARHLMGHESL
ncbi:hypothetical protein CRG98_041981 [Punica granatum]|uniref:Uncharacterized protein n=1 Tax=Punica granatum TaxID=22663 RepID=A0A2I0I155_PUNGR|nr:hypothetical protein CRG98_041981 [Punica granatum]